MRPQAITLLAGLIAKAAPPPDREARWSAMSESKVTACASAARRGDLCPPVQPWPRSNATGNRPPASTTWSAERSNAGLAAQRGARDRRGPGGVRAPAPRAGPGSPSWPPRSGSGRSGSCWRWRCSRLARNNADWYRLLDLAGMTDTLIADTDGVYHPGLFNDRMLLGMKGTMSEAELHILRARLRRRHPQQGRPRRAAPRAAGRAGLGRGRRADPLAPRRSRPRGDRRDLRAVRGARVGARGVAVAARPGPEVPAATGTATCRRRGDRLGRPDLSCGAHRPHPSRLRGRLHLRPHPPASRSVGDDGQLRTRRHRLPQDEWEVLHHRPSPRDSSTGTPTRPTRPASAPTSARGRTSPAPARSGRAARCCRGWPPAGSAGASSPSTTTAERKATPGYYCTGTGQLVEGRGTRHLRVGGVAIDAAVTAAFLTALAPGRRCRPAWPPPSNSKTATTPRWPSGAARSSKPATRPASAERRYRAVDPDNRLVARGLETEWEHRAASTSPTPKPNSPAAKPHARKP